MNSPLHDIAFLHTAEVHVSGFSQLMEQYGPGIPVRHEVDASLLSDATEQGLTPVIIERTRQALLNASSSGAKIVVCTCSTLGSIAEVLDESARGVSYMRVDRPMADQAVATGQHILIVAALETTLNPTRTLLESSARNRHPAAQLNTMLVPDAWDSFLQGDTRNYQSMIAAYLDDKKNYPNGQPDVIVLAQASMAPAAELCTRVEVPVLSSPALGVKAAIELLQGKKLDANTTS